MIFDEVRFFFFDFFLFFAIDVFGPWGDSSISEIKFIPSSCASDICISAPLLSMSPVTVPVPGARVADF